MKCLLLAAVVLASIDISFGFCYFKLESADSQECTTQNGEKIALGATLKMPDQCVSCSCSKPSTPGGKVTMSCCGPQQTGNCVYVKSNVKYGIHAGVMMPPPGCKIITENDGCTPKLVQIADETKLC